MGCCCCYTNLHSHHWGVIALCWNCCFFNQVFWLFFCSNSTLRSSAGCRWSSVVVEIVWRTKGEVNSVEACQSILVHETGQVKWFFVVVHFFSFMKMKTQWNSLDAGARRRRSTDRPMKVVELADKVVTLTTDGWGIRKKNYCNSYIFSISLSRRGTTLHRNCEPAAQRFDMHRCVATTWIGMN